MTTLQQLEDALRKADAAGNVEDARAFANAIRQMRAAGEPQQSPAQPAAAGGGSVMDALTAKIQEMDEFSRPEQPAQPMGPNPRASQLPGVLGDLHNLSRASAAGGGQGTTLGWGDELYAGVTAPIRAIGPAMAGEGYDVGKAFGEGLSMMQEDTRNDIALNPGMAQASDLLGSVALMGKSGGRLPAPAVATAAQTAGKLAAKGATVGGAYGAVSGAGRGETMEERLTGAATGGATGVLLGGAGGYTVGKLAIPSHPKVPTPGEMKRQAVSGFKASEATGAVISQPSVAVYADELQNMLRQEGLITPSGKVAGYPGVSHALNLIDDFAQGNTTIMQARAIRKQLGRAASSADAAEREIAVRMIEQFDDFMEALRPGNFVAGNGKEAVNQWMRARSSYHVAKKGESVEKLIETAARKHRKSRAIGIDAALRNQFDNFVSRDRNLRGFNPAERAALTRVGEGTPVGNAARAVGGLAPSSAAGLTFKGGVPYMIGQTLGGGPVTGAIAAGGTMGLGMAGRIVANMSTKQQAALASLIIRNGGKLPPPQMLPPALQQAFGGFLRTEGSQSPELGKAVLQMLTQSNPQLLGTSKR